MRGPFMTLLVVALLAVGGYALYKNMTTPEPLETRADRALDDLGNGNLGDAADELKNETPADRAGDAINDAVDNAQGQ